MALYFTRLEYPNYGFAIGTSWALWIYIQLFNFQMGLYKKGMQGEGY